MTTENYSHSHAGRQGDGLQVCQLFVWLMRWLRHLERFLIIDEGKG
jgi:hypothetical protein